MEKIIVKKGKDIIQYDDHSVIFHHKKIQFPISFSPFKWIGFIGQEDSEVVFDKNLHYFMNRGKIIGRKTIYLSHVSKYETLPTTEQELSSDDKDDFTILLREDKTDEGIVPNEEFVEEETTISSEKTIDDEYDADLYMRTDTIQLRLKAKHLNQILLYLKASEANELNTAKVGSFFSLNQELLAYDDEWAFHVKPNWFFDSEIDSTPIHYMAFILEKKPLLWGANGLYCGYHKQINIKHISKSVIKTFSKWCHERAPRLTSKGESYKSSILANPFNLWRWLYPDEISITDEALIYTRKTFRRDEMIYLPFKRISLFLSTGGWFTKSFEVYGEQNIIPKYSFSSSSVSAIKNMLEKHHIKTGSGRSWHSSYLFPKNWFGRAPRILNVDEKLIFYPKRIESEMKKYYNMKSRVGAFEQMEISEVVWYKPLFYWFGTIKITGTPTNIRIDQKAKTVTMIVPNLSLFYMFRYWFIGFFHDIIRFFLLYVSLHYIKIENYRNVSLRYFLKQSGKKINRKYKKLKFK